MIQRMSNQHKIEFLENNKSSEETKKSASTPEKTLNQISEEQKSKRLSNKDDGLKNSKHISSAVTGDITNQGGPSKHIKNDSSNTIWENDKTAKASKEMDSKTKTIHDKEQISSNRREAENKRVNDLVDVLKTTLQSKASSVSSAGTLGGTNYKVSDNNMSIFDKKDFSRLQDKTDGEKTSEDIKNKKAQKDDSWKSGGKVVKTKNLMDSLFTQPEK